MKRAIQLDPKDNVATALVLIEKGEAVEIISTKREVVTKITAKSSLPLGHKIALSSINKGNQVVKYGVVIGKALSDISTGEYVHVHNVGSERFPLTDHMLNIKIEK